MNPVPPHPVLVVMGVSGSGKSTVAAALVDRLGWAFQEGDDLHPAANIAKMAAGHALSDADRAPWLAAVAAWIAARDAAGEPGIVTCSALRARYRDVLRGPSTVFVHLQGPTALIADRLSQREGHFMAPQLLGSQVDALEPLGPRETGLAVDAGPTPAEQAESIIRRLALVAAD